MPTGSKSVAGTGFISGEREHLRFLRARKTLPQPRTIFLTATSLHVLWFYGQRFVFTRPMFGRNLAPNPLALRKKCEFANMSRSSLLSALPACTPAITHGWQSTLALSLSRSLFLSLSLAGDDRQNPYPSTMCCLGRNPQIFATNRRGPGAPPVRPRSSIPCSILARAR
jgi:hypothetical protein